MRRVVAALLLTSAVAAAPARAGWQRTQFLDAGGQAATPPALQLRAVGGAMPAAGQPARVWAVGGTLGESFIVHSQTGFAQAQRLSACTGIAVPLTAIWVSPTASYVHAFGQANSHAAFDGTGWACAPFTSPPLAGSLNIDSAAFSDPASGYIGGSGPMSNQFLGLWAGGTVTNATPGAVVGPVKALAFAIPSGRYVFGASANLFRVGRSGAFATLGSSVTGVALVGDVGVAVADRGADSRIVDASTDSASAPTGSTIDFRPVAGVSAAPKGFAVAVGSATSTTGAIAESYDGGNAWRRIDLSGFSPAVRSLASVACWDENSCAAVGSVSDGAGGWIPELLFYVNQAPTASVTVNGQPASTPVKDDASIALAASASDPEGDPTAVTWHGTGVEGSHALAPAPFAPAVSCASQTLTYSLEVTDGRKSGAPLDFSVTVEHAPRPPSAPTLSPAPPSANTYQWAAGTSPTVTASVATRDCNRAVGFQFEGTGVVPVPTVNGAGATYDLTPASGCGGGDGTLTVKAIDADVSVAPVATTYAVHVAGLVQAPQVSLNTGNAVSVPYGSTATVFASASHCSGTDASDFTWAWSCAAGIVGPSVDFANLADPCGSTLDCTLTVTPKAAGHPATQVPFQVTRLPPTAAPGLSFTFSNGAVATPLHVSPGQTVTAVVAAQGLCRPKYSWTCTGGPGAPSPGNADRVVFSNPLPSCSSASYRCDVDATSEDGARSARAGFDTLYDRSPATTSVSVTYAPNLAEPMTLAAGESLRADVSASNACASQFAWSWDCHGTYPEPATGASSVTFAHPGDLCAPQAARCTATATPSVGTPGSAEIEVSFDAVPRPPTGVAITELRFDGSEVFASGEALGGCQIQGELEWAAELLSAPGVVVERGQGTAFRFRPQVCGDDTVRVTLTERLSGTTASQDVAVRGGQGVPVVSPPTSLSFDPSDEPVIDCAAPAPIVLRPAVMATCGATYHWRQVSGPALATTVLADQSLRIDFDPGGLEKSWEKAAEFELTVSNAVGRSAPETFTVRPRAPRFVGLEHRADRRASEVGEPVALTVLVSTRCARALPAAVDLRLDLLGLELLPGTVRIDGETGPELARGQGAWFVRGLGTPAAGEPARVVTYLARRSLGASGVASSRARAFLSGAPDTAVSLPADGPGRAVTGGVPAVSCACSAGGGWLGAEAFVVVGLLLRRRRRAERTC